ncbi:hypothetical protein E4U47_002648 [Claviceps purpurea]|nr:hypothetical protein E4U47_002648 [Claviceps purpurea]
MGSADVPTVAPIIAFLTAGVETDSDFAGQFARRVSTVGVDIVTIRRAEETAGSIGGQASVSFMKFAGDIANTQRGYVMNTYVRRTTDAAGRCKRGQHLPSREADVVYKASYKLMRGP